MLYVVATPIGNFDDITLRARECLKNCDLVIGEETRVASTLLKKLGLEQKEIFELNEHTSARDLDELVELCAQPDKKIALISDCGTPGFQDPGPDLLKRCRAKKIEISPLPGASSLTALLSLTSEPVREFVFSGFLSADKTIRSDQIQKLKLEKRPVIFMDTAYRLSALISDLALANPNARALLAMNMTQPEENIIEGTLAELANKTKETKAEFMLLRYAIK